MVKAKELRSGAEQSIEVTPQYGLTDQEVESMLLDSITHAQTDIKTRALVEAQTEAGQLIDTTERFITKNESYLTPEEIDATRQAIAALQSVTDSGNKDVISEKTEALNSISRPYAERLMDQAVGKAISGKNPHRSDLSGLRAFESILQRIAPQ